MLFFSQSFANFNLQPEEMPEKNLFWFTSGIGILCVCRTYHAKNVTLTVTYGTLWRIKIAVFQS